MEPDLNTPTAAQAGCSTGCAKYHPPRRRCGRQATLSGPRSTAKPVVVILHGNWKRDKASLDVFWLGDESLEDAANLPAPDVIAAEIVKDLQAALDEFALIASDLRR